MTLPDAEMPVAVHYLADSAGAIRAAAICLLVGRAVTFDRALTDDERKYMLDLVEDFR
jgi:hypothetical protein